VRLLAPIALLALAACVPSFATEEGNATMTEVNIESTTYSDHSRELEGAFKEAIYVDVDQRALDYESISREEISTITNELRQKHADVIANFKKSFVADETASGSSEADAELRAAAYVDDYFQSLWDVQIDLNG
jgi:cell fate (sporulation/competence/biofilm development) regulator YmcA (YheA/YmcA/DUF963 family)